MSKIKTIKKLWMLNRRGFFVACFNNLNHTKLFRWMSDKSFLTIAYWIHTGKRMDWKNPTSFTQKIQWLKLHDRNPELTRLVDKITAKEYVAQNIGVDFVIPTLGVWDKYDDIDFSKLPNQFVLKTNNGSGSNGVVICRDKSRFDKREARKTLESSLKENTYYTLREWPYKDIPPCLFAETYIGEDKSSGVLQKDMTDYKFFCFGGDVRYCQVIKGRSSMETIEFFDTNWERQDFIGLNPMAQQASVCTPRPKNYNTMLEVAHKLSKGFPFVRVDLYDSTEGVLFGELTFYPASGLGSFRPDEYDTIMGELLKLPINEDARHYE